MPTLSLITNVPKYKVPASFLSDASKLVSEILKTPESEISVKIKTGDPMYWHNNYSYCGIGSLAGVGIYGFEENKNNSFSIYNFIEKQLGIPQNRLYISFVDQKPSNIGVQGTTLEEKIL
ncbi:macrophage migration inhibitory factor homolog isoform X7 [Adelges cooleyi]|uniref:macrophage migration inhibitory factor homolog isoform X1 n=1 Tax=Adelges cooleyi TaxID=133065 RepID=UPI00217FBCF1|nr:macrophage migration inhibitory factor homolog isoform X1 [Adelges cooleyi]XP_050431124.1 macrophage migration inhibitory factor homolog isoform X2 [Adelges cooleyi]XP_050431132.1 macrophage migration inhibitory factor homolog isoform X3 [Adelges cooleyi]XP_050431138.1 macrophage migration inhibitory factor homolog isoform X4 [Adelges cooleyi]XP_050431141.1 macrophage migration inhibitory factor homolog isoform X5 [Adelges cooleyi]XP_050431146.1 macrophage migration inhibitory factor homolo